jgi:hypothetical protein
VINWITREECCNLVHLLTSILAILQEQSREAFGSKKNDDGPRGAATGRDRQRDCKQMRFCLRKASEETRDKSAKFNA